MKDSCGSWFEGYSPSQRGGLLARMPQGLLLLNATGQEAEKCGWPIISCPSFPTNPLYLMRPCNLPNTWGTKCYGICLLWSSYFQTINSQHKQMWAWKRYFEGDHQKNHLCSETPGQGSVQITVELKAIGWDSNKPYAFCGHVGMPRYWRYWRYLLEASKL